MIGAAQLQQQAGTLTVVGNARCLIPSKNTSGNIPRKCWHVLKKKEGFNETPSRLKPSEGGVDGLLKVLPLQDPHQRRYWPKPSVQSGASVLHDVDGISRVAEAVGGNWSGPLMVFILYDEYAHGEMIEQCPSDG